MIVLFDLIRPNYMFSTKPHFKFNDIGKTKRIEKEMSYE